MYVREKIFIAPGNFTCEECFQCSLLYGSETGLADSVCGFRVDWKPNLTYAT